MTEEEMQRAGVVALAIVTIMDNGDYAAPAGKIFVRLSSVDAVLPAPCGTGYVYKAYIGGCCWHVLENPFLLGEQ